MSLHNSRPIFDKNHPSYKGRQVRNYSSTKKVQKEIKAYVESLKVEGSNLSDGSIASPAVIIAPQGRDAGEFSIELIQSD